MQSDGRVEQVSISLHPLDKALVRKVMSDRHDTNFSAAVRFILRDWAQKEGLKLEEVLQMRLVEG